MTPHISIYELLWRCHGGKKKSWLASRKKTYLGAFCELKQVLVKSKTEIILANDSKFQDWSNKCHRLKI